MSEITFETLANALPHGQYNPGAGCRLVMPGKPDPFVPPTLRVTEGDPTSAEVIIIGASAAVGKSTLAKFLSASRGAAMLDLAVVPVSTGSLQALISNLVGPSPNPVEAFHAGQLSVIVDALDEGRLLSTPTGFESFLETAGELLAKDRTVRNRVKLVMFGRNKNADEAKIWLQLNCPDVTTCSLEVGFFGEQGAWDLILAYAESLALPDAAYHDHKTAANGLVSAYFGAIEGALDLEVGSLWGSTDGVAFAGYAPVLAAIGELLAKIDNFIEVTNQLRDVGAQHAWSVIETVLLAILDREREKLCDKLAQHVKSAIPATAYDREEQLTQLTRHVLNQRPVTSSRVKMPAADLARYDSMVEALIGEHPFVRQGKFGNPVLAAMVLGHAVGSDLLPPQERSELALAARQPFLWRCMPRHFGPGTLIDGSYVGFLLSSMWSDPMVHEDSRVVARSTEPGAARVEVLKGDFPFAQFNVTLPLTLFGQVKDCDIDITEGVRLDGLTWQHSNHALHISGATTIICGTLDVRSDSLSINGDVWLEADAVETPPRVELVVKDGAMVGWGKALAGRYPWNRFPVTLRPPYAAPPGDMFAVLVRECSWRLPDTGGALTLLPDLTAPDDDPRMSWVARQFRAAFPLLMKEMVSHGLAQTHSMSASEERKVRISFNTSWSELVNAVHDPTGAHHAGLQPFIASARARINR